MKMASIVLMSKEFATTDKMAGVVPVTTTLGAPEDDARLLDDVPLSRSVAALQGKRL